MDWEGCGALVQKKHRHLFNAASGCSLEGGDAGCLERLGVCKWLGLLSTLAAAVWYESRVYDWWCV